MIYLDYAAATPVSKKALDAMLPYFADDFFNPSAAYLPAKKVRADYENAKSTVAHCIGAKGTDLVITSGATEANNLAFTVIGKSQNTTAGPRVLVLATEHDSVLNVAKNYDHELIKVDKTGLIDLKDFQNKLSPDVELVSISLANNEIGAIEPLAEISAIIKDERMRRLKLGIKTPIYLHSDASQAMNLIDINVARMGVDLMTLNAAKVYGPKGVGALYVSHEVKLSPIAYGGGQEMGLRSGTENVPGVIGFATAFKDAKEHINSNRKKYELLKGRMEKVLSRGLSELTSENEGAKPVTTGLSDPSPEKYFFIQPKNQLANFCPLVIPGIDAERLIYKLEEQGIYVSTGAACAASKGQKSKTLEAIGLTDDEINGSLRITFGSDTTEEDVKTAATAIIEAINSERNRR